MNKQVLAIDFGASSGRAMLGIFDGKTVRIEELRRFSNDPVTVNGTMYWDVLRLLHEVKQSLMTANRNGEINSVAIDTWGVDFGLLDKKGFLLENPVHYRDSRTAGMVERSGELISHDKLYQITGNQFMEINTAFQLLSLKEKRPDLLKRADKLLLMPDLFNYFLCGKKAAEASIASTTQMFDCVRKDWSHEVAGALGLPQEILPEVIQSGTVLGSLSDSLCSELEIRPAKVIAVAGHDTQCAMAATPATEKDFIFLSCGTWSLLGTELDSPVIDSRSREYNLTNECGYGGKTSFLKNIIGLWLIQESRRQWMREGMSYSFADLEQMARDSAPLRSFIDPDDPVFVPAGNIPKRIREYCSKTGQPVPDGIGEVVRCIVESLALKYRDSVEEISGCTGKTYETIYMLGGGTRDRLLCEMTAAACGCTVFAGPEEATVLGNVMIQLLATKDIDTVETGRRIIADSHKASRYEPGPQRKDWEEAYAKFKKIILSGKKVAIC